MIAPLLEMMDHNYVVEMFRWSAERNMYSLSLDRATDGSHAVFSGPLDDVLVRALQFVINSAPGHRKAIGPVKEEAPSAC